MNKQGILISSGGSKKIQKSMNIPPSSISYLRVRIFNTLRHYNIIKLWLPFRISNSQTLQNDEKISENIYNILFSVGKE